MAGSPMTTVQITLPDELAKQAEAAGLLASDVLGRMIEEALRIQAGKELLAMTKSVATEQITDEEMRRIVAIVREVRAERRNVGR